MSSGLALSNGSCLLFQPRSQEIVDMYRLSIDVKSLTKDHQTIMGLLKNAMISVGLAQAGPKITAHDRAILEYVQDL